MTTTITHTQVEIFVPVLVHHDSNNYTHTSWDICTSPSSPWQQQSHTHKL